MPIDLQPTDNFDALFRRCKVHQTVRLRPDLQRHIQRPVKENGGYRVLNYMPRKEACNSLEQIVSEDELKPFCHNAAAILRNLDLIYYADKSVDEAKKDKENQE